MPQRILGIALLPLVGIVVGAMVGIWVVAAKNGTPLFNPAVFPEGALLFPVPLAGGFGGLLGGLVSAAIAFASIRIRPRSARILVFVAVGTALIWLGSAVAVTLVSITAGLDDICAALIPGLVAGAVLGVVLLVLIGSTTLWKGATPAK
jgi:hypothetical protein